MRSSHPALVMAMRTHLGIYADRFAGPLDAEGHDLRFWSKQSRDAAFAAHTDASSCTWQGSSYAFAGTDITCIEKATKWGTLVGPTLPKTHRYCDCHPPQSHCQGQTYLRRLDLEVSQVLHHPRHHPPL